MKRLILVGAGHAHTIVLRGFVKQRPKDLEIIVISPVVLVPSSGMIPGWLAGAYQWKDCCINFQTLCLQAGAILRQADVEMIEADENRIRLDTGEWLYYDCLSLNVGSTIQSPVSKKMIVMPLRPLSQLPSPWLLAQTQIANLSPGAQYKIAVVGGGAAGVECLLSMHHYLAKLAPQAKISFTLLIPGSVILRGIATTAIKRLVAHLRNCQVQVIDHFSAVDVVDKQIIGNDGRTVPADLAVWATGPMAYPWLAKTGLQTDTYGFVKINRHLNTVSHMNIFAAGDCASWEDSLPKAGVYAVRMGAILFQNINRFLTLQAPMLFKPQRQLLLLIGTGNSNAIASWGDYSWEGKWVWYWKKIIDQKFLRN